MKITDIDMSIMDIADEASGVLAYCDIIFDDEFKVLDVRIIRVNGNRIVAMPSKKLKLRCGCGQRNDFCSNFCGNCGLELTVGDIAARKYIDTCHPIDQEFREYLNRSVLERYNELRSSPAS